MIAVVRAQTGDRLEREKAMFGGLPPNILLRDS